MPKQPPTTEEISNKIEGIPPETIIRVEENLENEDELLISSTPNAIPLTPRDLINQKAKEAREARKLPPIPGYAPSIEQFQDWAVLLDDDMWSHTVPYCYRLWPKIVRQLSDPENKTYIDIICKEHVDRGLINYLQDTHGGGTYKFIVLDLDQKSPKGDSKAIMQFTFKIDPSEYEPKLNLKEIDVNHKPNMGFINQMVSKGLMDSKGNVMTPNNGTGGNSAELAGAIGGMYDKFMTTFATMSKDQQAMITKLLADGSNRKSDPEGIGALLLEKLKQDDPSKQTQTMMTLITTMMSLVPKPEKQDTSIFQLLITQMNQSAERQMEMMKMMFQQNTGTKEPIEKEDFIDKLVRYRTALPELFSGGSHREPKKELGELILEGAKEFALPAIGLVSQFLQLKGANPIVPVTEQQARAMAEGARMGGVHPSPQAIQQQQPRVLTMPSQPQPNPTSGEPVKDPTTGKPVLDPNNLTLCQKLLIQYGGMLITAIKSGMDGATLADNLEGAKPLIGDIYGMLKAQGGAEILKAMESIPEFWNQTGAVYGKDHMEQLIADFLLDPEDEEEEIEKIDGKDII